MVICIFSKSFDNFSPPWHLGWEKFYLSSIEKLETIYTMFTIKVRRVQNSFCERVWKKVKRRRWRRKGLEQYQAKKMLLLLWLPSTPCELKTWRPRIKGEGVNHNFIRLGILAKACTKEWMTFYQTWLEHERKSSGGDPDSSTPVRWLTPACPSRFSPNVVYGKILLLGYKDVKVPCDLEQMEVKLLPTPFTATAFTEESQESCL